MTGPAADIQDRDVRIDHWMPAPPARVFEVFTSAEHTRKWLPPEGFVLAECEIDARLGGRFKWRLAGPDGFFSPLIEGAYQEVVPGSRLVYDNDNGDKSPGAAKTIAELSFDEKDGGTLFSCRVVFETRQMLENWLSAGGREEVAAGNARMTAYLASLTAPIKG